ncbi:MAG: DMT family transporter [Treponema sp.]|nr:DMT family transporter [Treponema sp.]
MNRFVSFLKKYAWILAALFCTMLWGTASSTIKIGYKLFPVDTSNSFNIILFAGIRFVGAGIITLLLTKPFTKETPALRKGMGIPIFVLAITQTVVQYFFYYMGLVVVPASVGAILSSTSIFFTVILVTLIFKTEQLTIKKILATILGFIGIVVLNIDTNFKLQFHLNGEGFLILSSLMNALASFSMSKFSQKHNPMTLTGYQFLFGGMIMVLIAIIMNGSIGVPDIRGVGIMLFLMIVASLAYGIWAMLLKKQPTSHVVIFVSFIPIFGAFFSYLMLKENIWNWRILVALALISLGTFLINYVPKKGKHSTEN